LINRPGGPLSGKSDIELTSPDSDP
jgi:hypothetical protein